MRRRLRTLGLASIALLCLVSCGAGSSALQNSDPDFELRPCTVGRGNQGECGRLTVPENRTTGQGRRITINFIVIRGESSGAKEAMFLLAGGPGQGSTGMTGTATGWMSPLRRTMDFVLMDQRGTGGSNALACETEVASDPASAFGHVTDPDVVRRCRAALEPRADLTQYTTDAAVADMEDLRQRLGYDRVGLYGGSYGTRLAQAYARRHPSRTKAVVIDGVAPFDNAVPVTYARSLQRSIDLMLSACLEREPCRTAYPRVREDLAAILQRLEQSPAQATVRPGGGAPPATVSMTKYDFLYAVRGMLYSAQTVTQMPQFIAEAAATGNLDEFARRYWSRANSLGRGIARGLHLSVFCAEDVPYASDADIEAAVAGTMLGRYLFDDYRRACALWPRGEVAADFRSPLTVNVPVLLVSGRFDPVTPPEFGDRVAQSLPNARHIVAPTGSHGSASGCPRAAVLHVLEKGTFDGMPGVCGL